MKRLVLCLDGTWNTDKGPAPLTNVVKLHRSIAATGGDGVRQVSEYFEGIASTKGEWAQYLKGAVGYGVPERIKTAYTFLVENYEPGDEIYLFGFSRGAFQARRLAGFIAFLGVARSNQAFSFDRAWALYCKRAAKRDQAQAAAFRASSHHPVRIKCVGVWDTVGSLGNPFFMGPFSRSLTFHDTMPLEAMDVGLHALSVDEVRGPFRPTLWTLPEGQALHTRQHVEQVWFAGSHADVGGGYRECALSDVALRWMAERAAATTGLAFKTDELAKTTRPDPLGPQHAGTTGSIFFWSGVFPFIRLVKQAVEAIPRWRRAAVGTWRTGKLPRGQASVNESIHDSVVERFCQKVIELRNGRSRMMTYRPGNLVPVLPEPQPTHAPYAYGKARRVKIFTVHGTFDHEAGWDNWEDDDEKREKSADRAFVSRLRHYLYRHGVKLEKSDHTQYNWSGGNSHDERWVGAIGLKKAIEDDLCKTYAERGKDYYDGGVYVVGHSHGGTIARMAMNLWDKDYDYYDPEKTEKFDEFKHDDQCQTCMRVRNGAVGPNTALRPDGVITFGSPFVNFEPRRGGLFTARLFAWVFRALALVPVAAVLAIGYYFQADNIAEFVTNLAPGWALTALRLTWPLALYWLVASYIPRLLLKPIERSLGKGNVLFGVSFVLDMLKAVLFVLLAVYYVAYVTGVADGTGGYARVVQWLRPLGDTSLHYWLAWFTLIAFSWLLVVSLPSWFLSWLKRKVTSLREKLPKKHDPAEDRPVSYLSYHTPGDEAGFHLRVFGVLTWLVQTLGLTSAAVLAVGVMLLPLIVVFAVLFWEPLLEVVATELIPRGLVIPDAEVITRVRNFENRIIEYWDWLTFYPSAVWSWLLGEGWASNLGDLENKYYALMWLPLALVLAIFGIVLLLMPLALILLGIIYLLSMWLRGSGVVFGSESMAWTLANRIAVSRRPNENTAFRRFFISPEAWWRREIAHCYYYKSDRVVADVANHIADWSARTPNSAWPVERWFATGARSLVVLLFVLSIFAVSVPIANGFAGLKLNDFLGSGNSSASTPTPEEAVAAANRAREAADRRASEAEKRAFDADIGKQAAYVEMYRAKGQGDEALATQSRLLAALSGQAAANGDTASAALFALEGLPESGAPRPLVSEARVAAYDAELGLRERLILAGHTGEVRNAAFSPDGARAVTASSDKTARLWDAKTGALLAVLGHEGPVYKAAFSPDGRRIVTASEDKTARIWDGQTGTKLAALKGHEGPVVSAELNPDGSKVVTLSDDKTARLWDATTGKELFVLKGRPKPLAADAQTAGSAAESQGAATKEDSWRILSVAFSPDSAKLATGSEDKTATVWDAATGKELSVLTGHEAAVNFVGFGSTGTVLFTFSEDGMVKIWKVAEAKLGRSRKGLGPALAVHKHGTVLLAASNDNNALIWDITGDEMRLDHRAPVTTGAFGSNLAATAFAGRDTPEHSGVRLWNFKSETLLGEIAGHLQGVNSIAFSPDDASVITASKDGTARIWDAGPRSSMIRLGEFGGDVAVFSPDGIRVGVAGTHGNPTIFDAKTGAEMAVLKHDGHKFIAFSPDGRRVMTVGGDGTARLWDAATNAELAVMKILAETPGSAPSRSGPDSPTSAGFSPDGALAMAAQEKTVRLWDARTGAAAFTLNGHEKVVRKAVFSPDGGRILTLEDNAARIWDAKTGTPIAVRKFESYVNDGAFSLDGQRVVTDSNERVARRVWDAATAADLLVLEEGASGSGGKIAFSPDGRRIMGYSGETARVWDAQTGALMTTLKGHSASVNAVAVSPDGATAATGSGDGTARIWDVATGATVAVLQHGRDVKDLTFSPDGKTLLTVPWAAAPQIWRLPPDVQTLTTHLRQSVPRCLTPEQRKTAYLPPEPPDWCIAEAKWPYQGQDWKDWLAARQAGRAEPMPAIEGLGGPKGTN